MGRDFPGFGIRSRYMSSVSKLAVGYLLDELIQLADHRKSTTHRCIVLDNPASLSHGICRALTQAR